MCIHSDALYAPDANKIKTNKKEKNII